MMQVGEKEKPRRGQPSRPKSSSGSYQKSQADSDFIRDFWRYQAYLRHLKAIHLGDVPEPDGSFYGDGVPRTAGGYPFTPLNWGGLLRI